MSKKEKIKEIYQKALTSVMPKNVIQKSLTYDGDILQIEDARFDLSRYKNVFVFGSGKASIEMAKAMQALLKERIYKTIVVSNYHENLEEIEIIQSTHPLPSQKSIDAADVLIESFESMHSDDFFIYLLSGGSSALIEKPLQGVSLEAFKESTQVLLHSGLTIDEINTIRKQISQIKGGGLVSKTKAKGVVLVVSDVIGDDLQAIGSAPLLANKSTLKEAREIINKYNILHLLPQSVQDIIQSSQTKRAHIPLLPHFIISSNMIALNEAKKVAINLGFDVKIITDSLAGDVKEVADFIINCAKEEKEQLLLFGGEATVEVKGDGKGGRNQELCLWILKQKRDFMFLSAGTDGIDGNSDAAGAIVSKSDYHDSIDTYLLNNDSYHYLKKQKSLLITGESGTNVMDIMIVMKG